MNNSNYERYAELISAINEDKMSDFLDTVDTISELEIVQSISRENDFASRFTKLQDYFSYFDFYKKNIKAYADLKIERSDFYGTRVFEKLKAHKCGQIVYYRFVDFCDNPWRGGIDEIGEYILEEKEKGKQVIIIDDKVANRENLDIEIVSILCTYTQLQVRSICRILFPELKSTSSEGNTHTFVFN